MRSRLATIVTVLALVGGSGGAIAVAGTSSTHGLRGSAAFGQYRPGKGCGKLLLADCAGSNQSTAASRPVTPARTSSSASGGPYRQSSGTSASTPAQVVLITTKHDSKLGTILAAGPKLLTVYTFEADNRMRSTCTGACTRVWPPVTGKVQVGGAAASADLGTITRPDGTTQLTYKGHPLYLYSRDKDNGDDSGEAMKSFGATWYALSPSGNKVAPS
jgi:predicted lipoprotein with Yx(FWY)xxD motif